MRCINGDSEIGFMHFPIMRHHAGELKLLSSFFCNGCADESATVASHKIDISSSRLGSRHNEISLILPAALKGEVLKVFKGDKPSLVQDDLASLSLRFSAQYLHTPNTIFALIRPFALSRINIVEVVSTYTELTVVVAEGDLQAAFAIMSKL
jgi:hypothetical protein